MVFKTEEYVWVGGGGGVEGGDLIHPFVAKWAWIKHLIFFL